MWLQAACGHGRLPPLVLQRLFGGEAIGQKQPASLPAVRVPTGWAGAESVSRLDALTACFTLRPSRPASSSPRCARTTKRQTSSGGWRRTSAARCWCCDTTRYCASCDPVRCGAVLCGAVLCCAVLPSGGLCYLCAPPACILPLDAGSASLAPHTVGHQITAWRMANHTDLTSNLHPPQLQL